MSESPTRLDNRARILADLIEHRIEILAAAMRPEGAPVPFTEQLTNEQALAFWRKHRYSSLGQRYIANMTPEKVAELDAWLAMHPDPTLQVIPPAQ